jgi:hypothetical protein
MYVLFCVVYEKKASLGMFYRFGATLMTPWYNDCLGVSLNSSSGLVNIEGSGSHAEEE